MTIVQLHSPADFQPTATTKSWDRRDPTDVDTTVGKNALVSRTSWHYHLDGQVEITINEDAAAPAVRRLVCSGGDFKSNIWFGHPVLVAPRPGANHGPDRTPIQLKFSPGLHAIGAWIGVCPSNASQDGFFDRDLDGFMWVRLDANPAGFQEFRASGHTGMSCPGEEPPPAPVLDLPFVAVRADDGERIVEVRFDARVSDRLYFKLGLSRLIVEP